MAKVTPVTLAKMMSDAFTYGPRKDDNGRPIRILKEGSPDWMTPVIHHAHGDMLPEDWRYRMIEECLASIGNLEDDDAVSDAELPEAEIYTLALIQWLGSHLSRVGYCDEAMADIAQFDGVAMLIQAGQRAEYAEIMILLEEALGEAAEEMAEDDEE